jgi:plastocyanin
MRNAVRAVACGVAIGAVGAPAPALADKVVEAQTVWRFDASSYRIDQGEKLTFKNSDVASPGPHNVTASGKGPDGRPLFASKTIRNGEQAPVEGAQQLTTGSYDFICTVHPFMEASLVVSDTGTPLPPGSGSPTPTPPPASDTRRPKLRVSLQRSSLRTAVRRNRLFALITSDEVVTLRMTLTRRLHGRPVVLGRATGRANTPDTAVRIGIRLSRAGRRALRRARRVAFTLLVEARDAAGNVTATKARRQLQR